MLLEKIETDYKSARFGTKDAEGNVTRDQVKISLLNTFISDIKTLAKNQMREATDEDVKVVLKRFIDAARDNITLYGKSGNAVKKDEAEKEFAILTVYQPKQMTDSELKEAIAIAFQAAGVEKNIKSMGKVMGQLKSAHDGTYDGGKASTFVREFLNV